MTDDIEQPVELDYFNVSIAGSFVLLSFLLSEFFSLGIGGNLIVAAVRCVVQLSIMGGILGKIFEMDNWLAVAGIVALLNLLGTFEAVANKSKRRFKSMFFVVLGSMLFATIPISALGSRFAMGSQPFWKASEYIPIVGMLCGNSITAIVVSSSHVLKEVHENKDKVEMYLAFGASRLEATKPVVREALRLALMPVINQLSVIGIIAIPGTMTGAILGGSSVDRAAKLQTIMMFLISAATCVSAILSTLATTLIVIDREHRIRIDRIESGPHRVWKVTGRVLGAIWGGVGRCGRGVVRVVSCGRRGSDGEDPER